MASRSVSRQNAIHTAVPLRARPDLIERAAAWFSRKWDVPVEEYRSSMQASSALALVPQWYIALDGDRIVAGAGIIDNDFHERHDLSPNVCAVYVETEYRKKGVARALLEAVCADAASFGAERLFLLTDHDTFYELLGWRFCEMVRDTNGALGRMYVKELAPAPRRCDDEPQGGRLPTRSAVNPLP